MHPLELILSGTAGEELEPDGQDLPPEDTDAGEELDSLEDEGFDISEFDEEDEGALYDEDDVLFIAGDEDLPDEPDDGDEDDEDQDDGDEARDWLRAELALP